MNFNQVSIPLFSMPGAIKLSELVNGVSVVTLYGPWDAEIRGITTDSRAVRNGWLFVAVAGETVDGHAFVQQAMEQGARVVVVDEAHYERDLHQLLTASFVQHSQTTVLVVKDTRIAVAELAARFYGNPAQQLRLIGVTGTNGKTTVSTLIKAGLEAAGEKVGLIGTVQYVIGKRSLPAPFTTPPAETLHEVLAAMKAAGCTVVVMEVSSHALALRRVHGLVFDVTVFTNLTHDHLDFHGDMKSYADAKSLLFGRMTRGRAVVFADDPWATHVTRAAARKRILVGRVARAKVRLVDSTMNLSGSRITLEEGEETTVLSSRLLGEFNAVNVALAYVACGAFGADPEAVARGLARSSGAPGRFERIASKDGLTAVVDYSHTPDALENALVTARRLVKPGRRLIVVFGCGGDRDHAKRPVMGGIASRLADLVVLTSDNPRSEDPIRILQDIREGIPESAPCIIEVHRRGAIRRALRLAEPGDLVLIAGKGHETYQILGTKTIRFDDREIVRTYFVEKRGGVRA